MEKNNNLNEGLSMCVCVKMEALLETENKQIHLVLT